MSSARSEAGIRSLRLTIDRLSLIDAEAAVLRAELTERNTRLAVLQAEQNELVARVPAMLQSMDIASNHNCGWESRLAWALRELATQYREAP